MADEEEESDSDGDGDESLNATEEVRQLRVGVIRFLHSTMATHIITDPVAESFEP